MRRVLVAIACVALVACESVPDIHFVEGDGGSTDGQVDGFSDDGSTGDALDDAPDGSTDGAGGCPGSPPPGYQGCCGDTPCKGTCNQVTCSACGACALPNICCAAKANAVACKPANAACQ